MISKHHNWKYDGILPFFIGDRRYGQDMVRDFYSTISHIGSSIQGIVGLETFLLKGGIVTKGTLFTDIDITELFAIIKTSVEIPDSFASIPPSKTTADISIPSYLVAQTDINLGSATLNGAATNYVKASYSVIDGNTRSRAKKVGSYSYEVQPTVIITVDTTAPTQFELQLATLVGDGSSFLTITDTLYTTDYEDNIASNLNLINSSFKGMNAIAVTNYQTTTVPAIKEQSRCEVNGTVLSNPSDITITGATINDTWYEILLTPSGSSFTASFIARGTGVWDDTKQGLYSGNNRVVAIVLRDGSGNFINKNILSISNRTITIKIEMGDWDMDASSNILVVHGIPDKKKIRGVTAIVRDDNDSSYFDFATRNMETAGSVAPFDFGINLSNATQITLVRSALGAFNAVLYDSTSFNRGWITITYEV